MHVWRDRKNGPKSENISTGFMWISNSFFFRAAVFSFYKPPHICSFWKWCYLVLRRHNTTQHDTTRHGHTNMLKLNEAKLKWNRKEIKYRLYIRIWFGVIRMPSFLCYVCRPSLRHSIQFHSIFLHNIAIAHVRTISCIPENFSLDLCATKIFWTFFSRVSPCRYLYVECRIGLCAYSF